MRLGSDTNTSLTCVNDSLEQDGSSFYAVWLNQLFSIDEPSHVTNPTWQVRSIELMPKSCIPAPSTMSYNVGVPEGKKEMIIINF